MKRIMAISSPSRSKIPGSKSVTSSAVLDKIRRQLEAGAPGVDNIDALKLQTYQGELEKQLNDIREGKELALVGLRTFSFWIPWSLLSLSDKVLEPRCARSGHWSNFSLRPPVRPEFTQAREGVKAFEKLVDATRADYYPVIFFWVFGSVGEATNRDRIRNPFIYALKDTAVDRLGVQWKFNLGITAGKVEEAERVANPAKQALAEQGIPFRCSRHISKCSSTRRISKPPVKAFAVVGSGSWRRCRALILGWGQART